MLEEPSSAPRRTTLRVPTPSALGAALVAGLCLLPMVSVALAAFFGSVDTLIQLSETVLSRYVVTTLWLLAIVMLLSATIGTATAWLVTMAQFPGRRVLEVLLVLP